MSSGTIKHFEITSQVKAALTDRWQSCALIAAQVCFAPDALCRSREQKKKSEQIRCGDGHNTTYQAIKTSLASKSLHNLVKRGFAESRRINGKRTAKEYRLATSRQNTTEIQ